MRARLLPVLAAATTAWLPPGAAAQRNVTHVLRGVVTAAGAPVRGADVLLLEALDAAVTDSTGRFALRTAAAGSVTVAVRPIGFAPASMVVHVDTSSDLVFAFTRQT